MGGALRFCDRDGHLAKTRPTLLWRTATVHAEIAEGKGPYCADGFLLSVLSLSYHLSFACFFLKKKPYCIEQAFSFFRIQKRGVVAALGRVH
jgi:hypothetical protein